MSSSLQCADRATLEDVGLMGPDVAEDKRLRIVFSDGKSLIFKPRKQFYGCKPDEFETKIVLDIDLSDEVLVDEILFNLRSNNLDEIIGIIGRDAYRRLCVIYLDTYNWAGDAAKRDGIPTVGEHLFAWSGSLLDNGGSGIKIRPDLEIEQILVARATP